MEVHLLIWLVMVLRAVVGQSFMTFMPVLLVSRGYSLVSGGIMITLFTLAGTVSGLMAGYLADRTGSRPVFLAAHLLMTPALLIMLWLPGSWIYAGVAVAGFFVLATMPLGVTLAQELAPGGRSMVLQPDDGPGLRTWRRHGADSRKTCRPLFGRHRAVGGRLHPPDDDPADPVFPKRKPDDRELM